MPEAASPEILARIKESFEWWNGGEPQLMLDDYAEDAELDISAVFTDISVLRSHEDMRRHLTDLYEAWEGLRLDSLDVLDVGRGRYVVGIRLWGKGRRSGAEVDQRVAMLYTLRDSDDMIVRAQLFPTAEAAIEFAAASDPAARRG
jgi:ketosteroid isomerase-like protein